VCWPYRAFFGHLAFSGHFTPVTIVPKGSANTGRLVAAWTMETTRGEGDSDVINHEAPTFCIQVPRFETSVAVHSARNTPWRSGPNPNLAGLCPGAGWL
jgi:hypothetical protein